jgi:hypothetical protein
VVAFFAAQAGAGKRASTLQRRLAAIGYMHKIASVPSPIGAEAIKATLSGIRRSIGAAPVRKKAATSDIVLGMAATVGGESLRQLRDRTSPGCHRLGVRGASGLMCVLRGTQLALRVRHERHQARLFANLQQWKCHEISRTHR